MICPIFLCLHGNFNFCLTLASKFVKIHLTVKKIIMKLLNNRYFLAGMAVIWVCFYVSPAFAYWIWTPETKKWVNPKYAVKDTAEAQFNRAEEFFKESDYKRAIDEYTKIFKKFPESSYVPKAQVAIGICYFRMNKFDQALEAYQKVIDDYPNSDMVKKASELEEELAENLMERKSVGQFLTPQRARYSKAAKIYQQIVDNFPFQPRAAELQYKVGQIYYEVKNFDEAIKAFEKVEKKYPESQWVSESSFMIGLSYWSQTPSEIQYHQDVIGKAVNQFRQFIADYPDHPKVTEAKQYISDLETRQAEAIFNIGNYYYKQEGSLRAASIYYRKVKDEFPETSWRKEAEKRLAEIEEIEKRIQKEEEITP